MCVCVINFVCYYTVLRHPVYLASTLATIFLLGSVTIACLLSDIVSIIHSIV